MSPRASTVLLLCGLLCAAGGGFDGPGIQAESSSAAKRAWEHVGPGLAGVMAPVAADPIDRGTIYIATMAGGIRRSLDNGETWATVNNGLATLATSALAVDAAGPHTVYVGTVGGGAYKSDDGGESWHPMAGGIQGLIVHPLVADPVHPGVVYAGTLGGSMSKTVDGGNTWPVVFTGTRGIFGIAIDPNHSDVVYFGTVGAGAFKSSNAGSSWTAMSTLTPRVIWTVAVDPADSQIVYAGSNEDGVWKSSDAGVTWSPVTSAYQLPAIYALTVIPVAGGPSIVFAGTAGAGIWKSVDGGATWEATGLSERTCLSLSTDASSVLYAGTDEEAHVSRDLGETWSNIDHRLGGANAFGYAIVVDPAGHSPGNAPLHSRAPARVLLSTNEGGLKISHNGGARWDTATGIQSREIRQVAFDPTNPSRLYAGSFFAGGVFKASIVVRHGRATSSDQTSSTFGPSQSMVRVRTSSTPAPTARGSSGYRLWEDLDGPCERGDVAGRSRSHHRSRRRPAYICCETERSLFVRECRSHVDAGSDLGVVGHHDRRK